MEALRRAAKDGAVLADFSIRQSLNFAQCLIDGLHPDLALRGVSLDRVAEEDSPKVKETCQRMLNMSLPLLDPVEVTAH